MLCLAGAMPVRAFEHVSLGFLDYKLLAVFVFDVSCLMSDVYCLLSDVCRLVFNI